jgi:hypothetical protein
MTMPETSGTMNPIVAVMQAAYSSGIPFLYHLFLSMKVVGYTCSLKTSTKKKNMETGAPLYCHSFCPVQHSCRLSAFPCSLALVTVLA